MRGFKGHFFIVILLLGVVACHKAPEPQPEPQYATLKEELEGIGLISDIRENPDTAAMEDKQTGLLQYISQYSMFFLQDLNHEDEGGDAFRQRICILFRGFDRPTVYVPQGYDWYGFKDGLELSGNLNANLVCVEHRNYGESHNQDFGEWEYQTVAQASADLHDIYQALRPIFKGKWISSGTSKSAEGSIAYAYYYPQDMSLAAGFCGPFVQGLDDQRFGEYLLNEVGSEQDRQWMKTAIRSGLQDGEEGLYQSVCQWFEEKEERVPSFTEYVFNVFDSFFQVFQYVSKADGRAELLETLSTNDNELASHICSNIEENRDPEYRAYFAECALQMGWQDNGYAYFSDLLEGTSFDSSQVIFHIMDAEDRELVSSYDGTLYADIVNRFFFTTTCPLLLYFSHDDPWTAGRPAKVGPNVKMVLNPLGMHGPYLNDPSLCPPSLREEVMTYVEQYVY